MQKVTLYIQPTIERQDVENTESFVSVDLMEEELISVTSVIKDVNKIDKLFTDYSRSFNLPASKTNNKIFKHWYNPDVDYFDSNKFASARIYLNHQSFKEGKIKLTSVSMKNNRPDIYKITFFGNVSEFTKDIKESQLSDLEWLNNFNHSATHDYVRLSLTSGSDFTVDSVSYTDAIVYPLLTHTQTYIFNQNGDYSNGMNIAITSQNNTQRGIVKEDLKPAIKCSLILKAIEEKFGVTFKTGKYPNPINGDDLFFSTTAFTDLYMWLHREKGTMATAGYYVGNQPTNYTNVSGDTNELLPSPAGSASTSIGYGYFSTGTGIFNLRQTNYSGVEYVKNQTRFTIQITPSGGFTNVLYDLQVLNARNWKVVSEKKQISGTQSVTFELGFSSYGLSNPAEEYYSIIGGSAFDFAPIVFRLISENSIQFGSQISVTRYVEYINSSGTTVIPINATITATNSSTSLTPQESLVTITEQVPKLKVRDFLNGLFQQFNLVAHIEELTGEIIVQTLDQYYNQGEQIDITKYVDTDKHTIDSVIPFSEIELKYSEPKSLLAEKFEQLNNAQYGEANFKNNSDEAKKYEVKLPFEHMVFERLQKRDTGTLSTIQTGTFVNQDLKPNIGKPLLLYCVERDISTENTLNYCNSTRTSDVLGALFPSASVRHTLNSVMYPSNTSTVGSVTSAPENCLHFGSAIDEFNLTDYGGENNSLFQTYYRNFITRVYNKKARIFKVDAILPLEVLVKLTLNDLIVLGTRAFTINKMTTQLQSGKTKLELLNVPDYDVFDYSIQLQYNQTESCQNASDLTPTFSPSGGTFTST